MPGFPVNYQLPELDQTHVHRVGDISCILMKLIYLNGNLKYGFKLFFQLHVRYRYHLMHSIHVEGKQILFSKQLKLTEIDGKSNTFFENPFLSMNYIKIYYFCINENKNKFRSLSKWSIIFHLFPEANKITLTG